MAYSVDLMAALRASRQDNNSKPADFPGKSNDKPYSFRDSLKEAVRDRSNDEPKKELVARAETKLKSYKKPELKSEESKKPEAGNEEKAAKAKKVMTELLNMLEELSKHQLSGMPAEEHAMQSIKEALVEIEAIKSVEPGTVNTELQIKLSELEVKLETALTAVKAAGGMMEKKIEPEFAEELKAVIDDTVKMLEADSEASATDVAPTQKRAEIGIYKTVISKPEADKNSDTAAIPVRQEKAETQNTKSSIMTEVKADQETAPEKPAVEVKSTVASAKPDNEAVSEEVKAAVESKIEKVITEGEDIRKQEADLESGKETSQQAAKTVNVVQHKQSNAELSAIRPEQMPAETAPEEVQVQAQAPKAERVSRAEVIEQIVKKAEVIVNDGRQEMRMQLEPENLGKLTLKLAVEKGLITAKFVAESYEVKQVIESNLNELRDMLQEKGLDVQNFSVSVGQENKGYNNGNAMQQWKETIRLNGRSFNVGSVSGYQEIETGAVSAVNPYSIHNGRFDYRA